MIELALLIGWLPAIAQVESNNCAVPVQDMARSAELRSYGCYGVRYVAYLDARTLHPELPTLDIQQFMEKMPKDPALNKRAAVAYLDWLRHRPGIGDSVCKVQLAYNMGPTGARRWLRANAPDNDDDIFCDAPYPLALQAAAAKLRTKETPL